MPLSAVRMSAGVGALSESSDWMTSRREEVSLPDLAIISSLSPGKVILWRINATT